jgi:predicted phosphodiesterase
MGKRIIEKTLEVTSVVAFVSDIHAPFEDKKAIDLTEKILADVRPDVVFFGGDIVDCYAVSDFSKDPRRVVRFQEEFDAAYEIMGRFMQHIPALERGYFIFGNHERRWSRLLNASPALISLRDLRLENLLRLDKLDIKLVKGDFKIGELFYMHGDEFQGGGVYPARSGYLASFGNIIFGHYHKAQVFYNRLKDGTTHGSFANPCLCELKQEYVRGVSKWQQGFSIVTYYGKLFRVETIVFFTDGAKMYGAYGGKLYYV